MIHHNSFSFQIPQFNPSSLFNEIKIGYVQTPARQNLFISYTIFSSVTNFNFRIVRPHKDEIIFIKAEIKTSEAILFSFSMKLSVHKNQPFHSTYLCWTEPFLISSYKIILLTLDYGDFISFQNLNHSKVIFDGN